MKATVTCYSTGKNGSIMIHIPKNVVLAERLESRSMVEIDIKNLNQLRPRTKNVSAPQKTESPVSEPVPVIEAAVIETAPAMPQSEAVITETNTSDGSGH